MAKYIKTSTIEAAQWTGGPDSEFEGDEMLREVRDRGYTIEVVAAGTPHVRLKIFKEDPFTSYKAVTVNRGDYVIIEDGEVSSMNPYAFKDRFKDSAVEYEEERKGNTDSDIPEGYKRYWKWRIDQPYDGVLDSMLFMDENGMGTSGNICYKKEHLVFKHEDQYIDVADFRK